MGTDDIKILLRNDDTAYGYQCKRCGGFWKVYQNEYHNEGCEKGQET